MQPLQVTKRMRIDMPTAVSMRTTTRIITFFYRGYYGVLTAESMPEG